MKILYIWEVGDKVKLPFEETGTIVKILDIIIDFKYEQLNPE